jgi:hypothetical protein
VRRAGAELEDVVGAERSELGIERQATALPNERESSGAVTKSPAGPIFVLPAL